MRRVVGVLFAFLIFPLTPVVAQQYPQYRRGGPPPAAQEECPQGRQIRAQKAYPSAMTDCEVLDADTAAENQKRQRRAAPPPVAQQPITAPVQKPAMPAAVVAPAQLPLPTAPAVQAPIQRAPPPETIHADYDARMVGNWLTSAKEDRFGDGGTFIAATGDGGIAIAVRCIQKTLTIGIMQVGDDPKPIEKGDLFLFKFRVDSLPVVETAGVAIADRLVQVVTEKALVKSIREGKETAVRLEDKRGVSSTHVFNTRGARAAFSDLSRECPLD